MTRFYPVLTCIALIFFFSNKAFSQTPVGDHCGNSSIMQKWLQSPVNKQVHEKIESEILRYRQTHPNTARPQVTVVLPVVVHIIHNNGPENISDAQVLQGIQHLNQAFANTAPYDPTDGVDCQVQFCLAKRDPAGNGTNGITRNVSSLTNMDMDADDIALKNLNRWDPRCYINIWLVNEICTSGGCGVAGYAYYPAAHGMAMDGIVAEARWFGSTSGNSTVNVHEMGHYLGLYHTFNGGCTNNNCLTDGDRVCDTPPDGTTAAISCNGSINSCNTDALSGFTSDQNDLARNYMDYGNTNCFSMFTQGQCDRMNWHLTNVRGSLLNCMSCLDPCPSPVNANYSSPGATVNAGSAYNFVNSSTNATSYEWYVNGVLQATTTNFNFTFSAISTYTIKLVAKSSSPLCSPHEKTIVINAVCPVAVSYTKSAATVPCGTNINFTNTSSGATAYEWYVNEQLQATTPNFVYTTTTAGRYGVKLVARNTTFNCTATFTDTVEYTCPVTAVFTPTGGSININTPVSFTNVSTGATGYQWLVNGQLMSTVQHFTYSFTTAGNYVVTLVSSNGVCAASQQAYYFAQDTCLRQTFQKVYTASGDEFIQDIRTTPDGGFIGIGRTNSFGVGNYDALVVKYNHTGVIEWSKTYGGAGLDWLARIRPLDGGGYAAVGHTRSYGTPAGDIWVIKLDNAGNTLWSRRFSCGTASGEQGTNIIQTSDGSLLVTAVYNRAGSVANSLLIKLDVNGNQLWARMYDMRDTDEAASVLEEAGAYVIAGQFRASTYHDLYMMKVNKTNGNIISVNAYDVNVGNSFAYEITKPGNYYEFIHSTTNDFTLANHRAGVLRLDGQGAIVFSKYLNTPTATNTPFIVPQNDGGYLAGHSEVGGSDIHLFKYNSNALQQWGARYNTPGQQLCYNVTAANDGGYVMAGSSGPGAPAAADLLLVKTDIIGATPGCTVTPAAVPLANITTVARPDPGFTASTPTFLSPVNITIQGISRSFGNTQLCATPSCNDFSDSCSVSSFQKTYGTTGDETAYIVKKLPGGGYIMAGRCNSNSNGGYDAMLLRTTSNGNIVWAKNYGGSAEDFFYDVEPTANGGFIAVGQTRSFGSGPASAFVVHTNANGTVLWSRALGAGTGAGEFYYDVIQTADGGFAATGTYNATSGSSNVLVTKLDNAGNVQWSRQYNSGNTDQGLAIMEESDSLVVAGYYWSGDFHNGFLMKVNKNNGGLYWGKSYDADGDNQSIYRIQRVPGGYSFSMPTTTALTNNGGRQVVFRTDVSGNITYSHKLTSATNKPFGDHVIYNLQGGYTSTAGEETNSDVHLYNLNSQKQPTWKKRFTRPGSQYINELAQENGGYYYMAGISIATAGGPADVLFIRSDAVGNTRGCTMDSTDMIISQPALSVGNYAPVNEAVTFTSTNPINPVINDILFTVTELCSNATVCDSLKLSGPDSVCNINDTILVTAKRNPGCTAPVAWSIEPAGIAQLISFTDSTASIRFLQNGQVKVRALIETPCYQVTDSLTLTMIHSTGTLALGPDINLCRNSTITLHAGTGFKSYRWQDGAIDSSYTANFPGTYHVQVEDYCGNIYRDTVTITTAPSIPFDLGPDRVRCNNDTLTITAPAGFTNYTWSPNYNISSIYGQSVRVWPGTDTVYSVVAQVAPGCMVFDTVRVRAYQAPPINLGNDTSFCQGGQVILNAGPGFSNYLWSTGDNTPSISVQTPGTYWVRGTTADGCPATDTLRVLNVYANPQIDIGVDTSFCQGGSVVLQPGNGFTSYLWQNGAVTPTFTATNPGLYWVQVTDANGCRWRDSMRVINVAPGPFTFIGNDTSFCQGGSVLLDAGPGFAFYLWSTGANTSSITANTPGLYWVEVWNGNNCRYRDSMRIVNVFPKPVINLGRDTILCQGATITLNPGAGYTSYLWQDGSVNPTFTTGSAGMYWVQVSMGANCTGADTMQVLRIAPNPQNFAPPTTGICIYEPIYVHAAPGYSRYLWNTGATADSVLVTTAGNYWVEVTTADGCTARESFTVFEKNCPEAIFFPTGFTPNSDGTNDTYKPGVYGGMEHFRLEIYNRYGERVFMTTDYRKGWDGTYKGARQGVGGFVWMCHYQFKNKTAAFQKGTLVLVR